MRRIYIALCSCLLVVCHAFTVQARQLNLEEAMLRARESKVAKSRSLTAEQPKLAYTSSVGTTNCFYVVNNGNGQGFMVVSADDCAPAVLGYVDKGDFNPGTVPPNVAYFLDRYTQQIVSASRMNRSLVRKAPANYEFIPTLIDARWNQGEPYNRLCTDYKVLKDPTVTGCVATAIAQIMRQYEWPKRGKGSHSYTTSCEIDGVKYEVQPSANFEVDYEWDKMLFDYNNGYTKEQGDAVALLMRHVGVACNMGYSPGGSGAGVDTPIHALSTYFGYDKAMSLHSLSNYTDETFAKLLYDELAEGRPLYAAGNGHAFICDGYDGEGYFHWNWGWGGSMDGYFMLMGNKAVGGYRDGLCAIVGIQPDKGGKSPTIMSINNYSFSLDTVTDYGQAIKFDGFMYNKSSRKVKVMYAFKFENEDGSFLVPGNYATLNNNVGLTAFDFRCQAVPNGTYKVYPAYRDLEDGEWNFPSCTPEGGIPTITVNVPVNYIYTAQDLVAYREKVAQGKNECAVFMNDIDMSEVCGTAVGSWTPIGSSSAPFKGRVVGNGHLISNLYIRNSKDFQGLFGVVGDGAYISGITLDASCNVKGGNYVGGIAGGSNIGGVVTIENCGNEAYVSATMNGAGIIGCSYGQHAKYILKNCYNSGIISGSKENAALCAWLGHYATVENCYNIARVSGNDGANSMIRFGNDLFIRNCYQLNTITPRQKDVTALKRTEVSSGRLAYLLNLDGALDTWFQNLDTTQVVDDHPVLLSGRPWVYACQDGTYSNVPDDLAIISDGEEYKRDSTAYCNQVRYSREFTQSDFWEPLFVPFPSLKKDWGEQVCIAKVLDVHHYDDNADGKMERIEMEARTLSDTDSVKVNTPYLVLSETPQQVKLILHRTSLAQSYGFTPTWCANALVKFNLQGVYSPYTTSAGDYVLSDNSLSDEADKTIAPQRWFVSVDQHETKISSVQRISLKIDGMTATGISFANKKPDGTEQYYDLSGRPVKTIRKGIYIKDGKKTSF